MNDTRMPPAQRRRQSLNPAFILMILSIGVLIALIILLGMLVKRRHNPSVTEPPAISQPTDPIPESEVPTQDTSEPDTSEPTMPPETTNPSTPPETTAPTIPAEPTARDIIAEFAANHNLTLADYPDKLIELLDRNPETKEFVLNYPLEYGKEHTADISGYADYDGVPLFIQWDQQWGYKDYTGNVAGLSACGPTCMSMVAYHFFRDPKYTPAYMMDFAMSSKDYVGTGKSGTQWGFFQLGAKELGLKVQEFTLEQSQTESYIAKTLESGKVIVMHVKPGVFTTVGHYLLITGYENGKFKVNDPNSRINSEKLWEFSEFSDQIRIMWAMSA